MAKTFKLQTVGGSSYVPLDQSRRGFSHCPWLFTHQQLRRKIGREIGVRPALKIERGVSMRSLPLDLFFIMNGEAPLHGWLTSFFQW